jgi:hypothetical protein
MGEYPRTESPEKAIKISICAWGNTPAQKAQKRLLKFQSVMGEYPRTESPEKAIKISICAWGNTPAQIPVVELSRGHKKTPPERGKV